jgi:Bacteriocin-protection, YdeI or OmpD-Associated/Domain of unknown function (DUF1905)
MADTAGTAANPAVHTFQATLVRPDAPGAWTYLVIPLDVETTFGERGQVRVRGTINGEPYRNAAMPQGDGTHFLVVNKAMRDRIGATVGSVVTVTMERDDGARSLEVPDDLRAALEAHPAAQGAFESLSYSHKKEYTDWIASAKTEATRQRRIAGAVERIAVATPLKGRGARESSAS